MKGGARPIRSSGFPNRQQSPFLEGAWSGWSWPASASEGCDSIARKKSVACKCASFPEERPFHLPRHCHRRRRGELASSVGSTHREAVEPRRAPMPLPADTDATTPRHLRDRCAIVGVGEITCSRIVAAKRGCSLRYESSRLSPTRSMWPAICCWQPMPLRRHRPDGGSGEPRRRGPHRCRASWCWRPDP